jgi:hypothetical protein
MAKRKHDQIGGHNPWEIEAAFYVNYLGNDPDKARTAVIFRWMWHGDYRPLAWAIDEGHPLGQAVLNLLAEQIAEDRLRLKARKHNRPKDPSKPARTIVAALAYKAHTGKSDEAFAEVAEAIGVSEATIRQAVTAWHKRSNK